MERYDVIVIGGGHAGCEAALASARIAKTALLTESLDLIAHIRNATLLSAELSSPLMDALRQSNAAMPFLLDRILVVIEGNPTRSLDPLVYHRKMKHLLERTQNLDLFQTRVDSVISGPKKVEGVITAFGKTFSTEAVILSTGSPGSGSALSVRYRKEARTLDVKKDHVLRIPKSMFFAGEVFSEMSPVKAAAHGFNAGVCASNQVLHSKPGSITDLIDLSLLI